jgi:hypothetical protein
LDVVQAVHQKASVRRSVAFLLVASASARADVHVQIDLGLFATDWSPPSATEPKPRSISTTSSTMTSDLRQNSLGGRMMTGLQIDDWRGALDFGYSPSARPFMTWRAVGAYAPHLGPLQLELGAAVGVASTTELRTPEVLAYLNGALGLRFRIGDVAVGASIEHSIVATESNWIGGLTIGFDMSAPDWPATPRSSAPSRTPAAR